MPGFRRAAIAAALLALPAGAAAVDLTGRVRMDVVAPISISLRSNLDFGQVIPGAARGRFACTPGGQVVRVSGLTQVGGCEAGSFRVTGEPYFAFSISLPQGAIELDAPGAPGGGFVSVDKFKSRPKHTGVIGSNGSRLLRIGARLRIKGDTPPGHYSAVYNVSVDYN